jgi:hypothetical protein
VAGKPLPDKLLLTGRLLHLEQPFFLYGAGSQHDAGHGFLFVVILSYLYTIKTLNLL